MRRKLFILGTSGLAREMAMVAEQINARSHYWDIAGFIGEEASPVGKSLGVAPIVGSDRWFLEQNMEADIVIGIGHPRVRARVAAQYMAAGDRFRFPNLIHPSAQIDFRRVDFGVGNVVTAGCAFTCDIQVSNFNLFNLNLTVGHDARIGDCNVLNPSVNISGYVVLGSRILVGTGAQVLENLEVGDEAVLGAGTVVRKNVAPGETIVGVPGKPLVR